MIYVGNVKDSQEMQSVRFRTWKLGPSVMIVVSEKMIQFCSCFPQFKMPIQILIYMTIVVQPWRN